MFLGLVKTYYGIVPTHPTKKYTVHFRFDKEILILSCLQIKMKFCT